MLQSRKYLIIKINESNEFKYIIESSELYAKKQKLFIV